MPQVQASEDQCESDVSRNESEDEDDDDNIDTDESYEMDIAGRAPRTITLHRSHSNVRPKLAANSVMAASIQSDSVAHRAGSSAAIVGSNRGAIVSGGLVGTSQQAGKSSAISGQVQQSNRPDKGREGLPHSVADLLSRSAQVRQSSVQLRSRNDTPDSPLNPITAHHHDRSSSSSRSIHKGPSSSGAGKSSSSNPANVKKKSVHHHPVYDDSRVRRRSVEDDFDGDSPFNSVPVRGNSGHFRNTSRSRSSGLERLDHGATYGNCSSKKSINSSGNKQSLTNNPPYSLTNNNDSTNCTNCLADCRCIKRQNKYKPFNDHCFARHRKARQGKVDRKSVINSG